MSTGVDVRAGRMCRPQLLNKNSQIGPVDVNDVMHRKRGRGILGILKKSIS